MSNKEDIYSCGFYYVLNKGVHLFGNDSEKAQDNIQKNKPKWGENSLKDEMMLQLIREMIKRKASQRPPAEAICNHPWFWSRDQNVKFIKSSFRCLTAHNIKYRDKKTLQDSRDIKKIENSFKIDLGIINWLQKGNVSTIISAIKTLQCDQPTINGNSFMSLLEVICFTVSTIIKSRYYLTISIRNKSLQLRMYQPLFGTSEDALSFWLSNFPDLVWFLYFDNIVKKELTGFYNSSSLHIFINPLKLIKDSKRPKKIKLKATQNDDNLSLISLQSSDFENDSIQSYMPLRRNSLAYLVT